MAKKLFIAANFLMMQYLLTSHYQVAHKWLWLALTGVILGIALVRWNAVDKQE